MSKTAKIDNVHVLQTKLASVRRGARGFVVIQIAFVVIGILLGVVGGVRLLGANGWEDWSHAAETASSAGGYLLLAWLAGRTADAFDAIVALISEMSEIV
jgi:hypothetical protein